MRPRLRRFVLAVATMTLASCSRSGTAPESAALQAPPSASEGSAAAVEQRFAIYRAALLSQNGKAAADAVTMGTIRLYQDYRDLAVSGTETTVRALSLIDRIQVLGQRQWVEPKLLKSMDGKSLFVHAVDNNWIGKDTVARSGVRDVALSGTRATARVTKDGKLTTAVFHFVNEEGQWNFDLVPTIKAGEQAMQDAVRKKGMSEDEFIFAVISTATGKKVTEKIWQPLE